jgi:hypothetical protein
LKEPVASFLILLLSYPVVLNRLNSINFFIVLLFVFKISATSYLLATYYELETHCENLKGIEEVYFSIYVYMTYLLFLNSNFVITQYLFPLCMLFGNVIGNGFVYGWGS